MRTLYLGINIAVVILAMAALLVISLPKASAKFCTKIQSETRRNTSIVQVQCKQKLHESCGFADIFNYCTYYRMVMCEKQLNFTYTWYYAIQVCCDGYIKTSSGTCLSPKEAAKLPPHLHNDETRAIAQKHLGPEKIQLSSGAYAGIAAAGVLLLCLFGLLVVVLYRRHRKKPRQTEVEMEQRVALQQTPATVNSVTQNSTVT